jgi:hypothetical protein
MDEDSEGEKRTRKAYLAPEGHERRHKNGFCFKSSKKGLTKDCPNLTMMTMQSSLNGRRSRLAKPRRVRRKNPKMRIFRWGIYTGIRNP